MLPWWVSYCRIGDLAIFLDVRRNRYRAMAWESARALIDASASSSPEPVTRRMRALGWLDDRPAPITPMTLPPSPAQELAPQVTAYGSKPFLVTEALWALGSTRLRLAIRSLERNLAAVRRINRKAADEPPPLLTDIAPVLTAFRMAERYVLTNKTCLLRSLALQAALARRGMATSVVFGVKLQPFEAHCWLQHEDTLLNDTVERTGLFTPIRVVH